MHAVVHDADAEEHRAGDETVRHHLHHAALERERRALVAVGRVGMMRNTMKKPSVTKPMCAIDE